MELLFDVFISYSSLDKPIADHICNVLEQYGFACWIAPRNIRPGQRYALEIMHGIKSCYLMVLILSKNSNQSAHVANEVDRAFNENKPIIPFLIDDIQMNDEFAYYLSRKQLLMGHPNYEDKLLELSKAVAKTLERTLSKISPRISKPLSSVPTPDVKTAKPISLADEELFIIKQKNKYGFADKRGMVVIPCKWLSATPFKEGLSLVWSTTLRWGFINTSGVEVIPCKWLGARDFSEGLASVRAFNEKWGFINKNGKVVVLCSWSDTGHFSEGLASVRDSNMLWGYINKSGKVVCPCKWKNAREFKDGLACVKGDNKKWGYINKMGNIVISCCWSSAGDFTDGRAQVFDDYGRAIYIDKKGKILLTK